MSYILAKPTFSTTVDDALAAVDVYKQNTDVTINSFQEAPAQKTGLFDKLTSTDTKTLIGDVASSLTTGAKVALALARGKATGDFFGAGADGLSAFGVTKTSELGGLQGSLKTLSAGLGLVRSLGQAKSISQILGTAGNAAGRDGAALNKLSYATGGLTANLSSFKNMKTTSDLNSVGKALTLGAGMSTAVGSILGDLSPAVSQSYNLAAKAAIAIAPTITENGVATAKATDSANAAVVTKAIGEFTGGTYKTAVNDSAGLAGSVAGITYVGHQTGLVGTFKALTDGITDTRVVKAAALPLLKEAATTGNVAIFNDVASSKVGNQLSSAIPELASGMVSTATPPPALAQQEYSRYYDSFKTSLNTVSPNWQVYSRSGGYVVNAAYVAQNPFMQDLISAKMNAMMGSAASDNQSIYSLASSSGATIDPSTAVPQTLPTAELTGAAAVISSPTATLPSTSNEAFMTLASVFPAESVDDGLQTHFEYVYAGLGRTVIGIPA